LTAPESILDLLSHPQAQVQVLDPRGRPWLLTDDDWVAVLRRFPPQRYPPATSVPHVMWLHQFLDRLAATGLPAPRPLPDLAGASIAVADGALWELLSFVPGRPLMWDPNVPLESAGALLARFHLASLTLGVRDQRPGALPLEHCRPACAGDLVAEFQCDLVALDEAAVPGCVIHGDCTLANMLVEDPTPVVSGLIDFTLAMRATPESDISFALWVSGRRERLDINLDFTRLAAFVSGYHRVRPLTEWAVRAMPVYLVGRGLQMLTRIERAGGRDQLQLDRVNWLREHRAQLEDALRTAIHPPQ
jgi:Ser/Thr protein kinase RdoA (MazF antagonist)